MATSRVDARVELPRPVAVARVDPLGADFSVPGVAQPLGVRRHQLLGELPDHLPQQVAPVLLQVLAQPGEGIHRVGDYHRISSSDRLSQDF
jgi:hypothetical protein